MAAVAVGCGGGGSSSSSTAASSAATSAEVTTTAKAPPKAPAKPAAKGEGNSGSTKPKPQPSIAAEEETPGGDHSIQEYGAEAQGEEAEAVLTAMRSFLRALATNNYTKVCAGLTASNRQQLAQITPPNSEAPPSCAALLSKLVNPAGAPEAKQAATAQIGKVRIGKGSAFVLFRPQGGKLSYFVMKEEGGQWKATSLGAGTPLYP